MAPLHIVITGQPVAKGRPRFAKSGHAFTPAKTRSWENDAKQLARIEMRTIPPLEGPLSLSVVAIFPIPKSWPAWKREMAERGEVGHTTKPDGDNLVKIVKDSFNGIVWLDDAQVVKTVIEKVYGKVPMVAARVERVNKLASQCKRRDDRLNERTTA